MVGKPSAFSPGVTPMRCPTATVFLAGGPMTLAEAPAQANVASLCVDRTEVTVGEYEACVVAGDCSAPRSEEGCNWPSRASRADHPINCIDMTQAATFCATRGRRLPTEAEWEFAARGGLVWPRFPWGDADPGSRTCWNGPGNDLGAGNRPSTCPVGKYPLSNTKDGIVDAGGNVAEWTSSRTPDGDAVVRGGAWSDQAEFMLSPGYRRLLPPSFAGSLVGARCVVPSKS